MIKTLRDTQTVFMREMTLVLRDPFSLIFSLLQPLVFLILFGPLLSGALSSGAFSAEASLQWFVPGVLVMIALFGTSATGSNLLYEMQTGSYERMLVTPLSRPSLLLGRALKEMAPLMIQAALIALALLPFGFVIYPAQALTGLLLLGIFGSGWGALSYTLAIASRHREWLFWSVYTTLQFPLLILSGMMLPLEAGPAWMQVASRFNPLTYMVNAERALFAGRFDDPAVLHGVLAATLTCAVGLVIGVRAIRRSTV
ncbi:ABC-2 type transport system permease protein [Deinobacterium chartae]|uniref:Transport permease protein n=1 Tax=Deinobacterium chartae TaxID=521158 RepID=A0A841I3B1_9DEIO|nr:ABC transporter permease [Deinobacterium chartae]MBB6099536.1 ABC-2 type transport system permease protein [Deinobacterium chartae]